MPFDDTILITLHHHVLKTVRKQQLEKCITESGIYVHMQLVATSATAMELLRIVTFGRRKFSPLHECFNQT